MSIKGFPSSQKLPLGTGITNEFVTVVPSDEYRYSLDSNRPLFRVNSSTVPRTAAANTGNIDGMTWVYDTSTPAKKGDFVRFETGNAQYIEVPIVKVETNRFMLGALVSPAPAAGDTFYILRSVSSLVNSDGSSSSALPTGAATSANQVLEIAQLTAINGKLPSTLGTKTAANSLSVTMASDQPGQKMDIEYALGQYVASNSTTTPLGVSGNFTGAWVETTNYAAIQVGIYTDQNSSSSGFKVEFSADGSTVQHTHSYTYETSSNGTGYTFQPEFKYFRVNYTNDGVAQTYLTIYTALKPVSLFPSQYRVEQAISGQSQALVTKGVIYGLTTAGGGSYVAAKVTPSGALATATSLDAGTNLVGKVGIDQTTNGTTNAVYVNNFPATQPVSGSVSVSNFPATQAVTGTFWQATQPVSGTFWQATQPISAASLPLPTNASTSAAEGSVGAGTAGTKSLLTGAVYNSAAPTLTTGQQVALQVDANGNLKTTATFTGSIGAVNQGTANTVGNAWPILVTDGTRTATIKAASTAATTSDLALVVALSPNTPSPATAGRNKVAQLYNDYTSTSVTTSAYTQLTASTASAVNKIEIFDSSGEALILAVGGAGSEVDQLYIFPGGNGPVDLAIPASSRISVKAKTATASAGFLAINLYS